jgi:hypothetical protein
MVNSDEGSMTTFPSTVTVEPVSRVNVAFEETVMPPETVTLKLGGITTPVS